MQRKILLLLLLTLSLLSSTAFASAQSPVPAMFLQKEYIHAGSMEYGLYVSAKVNPQNGLLHLAYYDPSSHNVELAVETQPGTGNCSRNNHFNCEVLFQGSNIGGVALDIQNYFIGQISYTQVGVAYIDNNTQSLMYTQKTFSALTPNPTWTTDTAGDFSSWAPAGEGRSLSLKYMPVSHLAVFAAQISEPTTGAEKG